MEDCQQKLKENFNSFENTPTKLDEKIDVTPAVPREFSGDTVTGRFHVVTAHNACKTLNHNIKWLTNDLNIHNWALQILVCTPHMAKQTDRVQYKLAVATGIITRKRRESLLI